MVKSLKGVDVDFNEIRRTQGDTIAIGNAKMNARGDLLGKGGKVVKTREQLAQEYHAKSSSTVKTQEPMSKELIDEQKTQKQKSSSVKTKSTKQKKESALEAEMNKQKK